MRRSAWLQEPGVLWAAAGAAAGLLILVAVLAITGIARSASRGSQTSAPVVTLLPRPSPTELPSPSPTTPPTETPQPAAAPPASSGSVDVGAMVEVYGTEGDGLRLRASAGTVGTIRTLAGEAEVFLVEDGPVEADGRAWFYLVSPSDASRAGWAVADYLRPAQ